MAVFRRFFGIINTALFALLLCFASTNSFACQAAADPYNLRNGRTCPAGWGYSVTQLNVLEGSTGFIGSCYQCPQGTYKASAENTGCTQCPDGWTNSCVENIACNTRVTTSPDTLYCSEGYRNVLNSETNTYTCQPCPMGTYSGGGRITACTRCDIGTTTYEVGSESCNAPCPNSAGVSSWSSRALNTCTIESCESNLYLDTSLNTWGLYYTNACTECPSGYTCDGTSNYTEINLSCNCTVGTHAASCTGTPVDETTCSYTYTCADGYYANSSFHTTYTAPNTSATTYTARCYPKIILDWDENGGTEIANGSCLARTGYSFVLPSAPTREGYTFTGWKLADGTIRQPGLLGGSCNSTHTGVSSGTSTAIQAQWTPNTITLDWNEDGGDEISNGSCTYGGDLTLPSAPSRYDGYRFTGWKLTDGTIESAGVTITGGCILDNTGATSGTSTAIQALWDIDCQCVPGNHVASCGKTLLSSTTCKYNYTCESGYYAGGTINLQSSQTNTTGLASSSFGIFSPQCYEPVILDWDENGGDEIANGGCVFPGLFKLPSAPTRSGYTFTGWKLADGTITSSGTYPCNSTYLGASNGETSTAIQAQWDIATGYYYDGHGNPVQCPSGYRDGVGAYSIYGCYASDAITCQDYHGYDTGAETVTYATPNSSVSCKRYYDAPDRCVLDNPAACNVTNISCDTGYYTPSRTAISGRWDLSGPSTITLRNNTGTACYKTSGAESLSNDCDDSVFDGIAPGDWVAQYSSVDTGKVYGVARCSATTGTNYTAGNPDFSTTGDNCWCRVEKQANRLNLNEPKPAVSSWVYIGVTQCETNCAATCALGMFLIEDFRSALYSSIKQDCELYHYGLDIDRACPSEEECDTPSQPYLCQIQIGNKALDIEYGKAFSVPAPSACDGYTFNGWNITNMDSSTHYVGTSDANLTTTNATSLSNVTYTRYKNLRSSGLASATVTFTGQWTRSCASNEMLYTDPNTSETTCIPSEFELTIDTTKGDNTEHFEFYLGATGTFYVDWGDGNVQKIEISDVSALSQITHDYSTHYNGQVRFNGVATGYNNTTLSTIRFNTSNPLTENNTNVKKITGFSGKLGNVFGTVDNPISGTGSQPRFGYTFYGATNMIGSIPADLFDGIHGVPAPYMFFDTFAESSISGQIPESLFCQAVANNETPSASNCIYGAPAYNMFSNTFANTDVSGQIPAKLFAGIHGAPADSMFSNTFQGCEGLTGSIPESLFCQALANNETPSASNCIYGAPAQSMFSQTFYNTNVSGQIPAKLFVGIHGEPVAGMFSNTFYGCSGLEGQIPESLFCQALANTEIPSASNCIYGAPANNMFYRTFAYTNVSGQIPAKLFVGIHGETASDMFNQTFSNCKSLTGTIPETLFCQDVNNPSVDNCIVGDKKSRMFQNTFEDCRGLSGYIPPKLFVGISSASSSVYRPMDGVFVRSGLAESCEPYGMDQYITGFESYFDGKVSCESACPSGQFKYRAPGAEEYTCVPSEFEVTIDTTKGDGSKKFEFLLRATGTFYVDWGDGTVDRIYSTSLGVGYTRYSHTYNNHFVGNVKFSGEATGYYMNTSMYVFYTTIKFNTNSSDESEDTNVKQITGISGKLGNVFSTVDNPISGTGSQPTFASTFSYATNMVGSIPADLFDGVHGAPVPSMFANTFMGCTALTGSIPASLFCQAVANNATPNASNCIYGAPADAMFSGTFDNSGVSGNIPANLFAGIRGAPAISMFNSTFARSGVSGSIPAKLFAGIHGAPAEYMFANTFKGCTALTGSIPASLFCQALANNETPSASNCIYGAPAPYMFVATFMNSGVSGEIPAKLFAGIHGAPAGYMFQETFANSNVSGSIPASLFCQALANNETPSASNCIYGAPYAGMFYETFKGTDISGRIPAKLFAGIHGAPDALMFKETFANSKVSGPIPESLFCQAVANNETPSASNCIYGPAKYNSFASTFNSCSDLSSYIPPKLFVGITTTDNLVMSNIFTNSGIAESCEPYGMEQYITGFESYFDGKVSCDCAEGSMKYIDQNTGAITCVPSEFELTIDTTKGDNSKKFEFKISAAGTFYVDWGDGTVDKIERDTTNVQLVPHTYSSHYNGNVRFNGTPTGYRPDNLADRAAIRFNTYNEETEEELSDVNNNVKKITGVSGKLGNVFSTVANPISGTIGQPAFARTFSHATNWTGSLSQDLFDGVSGAPRSYMFHATFLGSGVTGNIPNSLFSGIHGAPAKDMFRATFSGCTGLTGQIPPSLFCQAVATNATPSTSNCIYGAPAPQMFFRTFHNSGVSGDIPAKLFAGIHGEPAKEMFYGTFESSNVSGQIPPSLFCQAVATNATPSTSNCIYGAPDENMFGVTFHDTSLSGAIPEKLFVGIHGEPAKWMFAGTFADTLLSDAIPEKLFCQDLDNPNTTNCIAGTPVQGMFKGVFNGSSNLSSYIPPRLFVGISQDSTAYEQMKDMFLNTGLATSCEPYGMEQYITGFESWFDGKVSCVTRYNINYQLGIGETLSEDSPTTFAEYRLPVQLGTATKPGYTFDGWRDNAQLNGVAVTEIPVGTNHDVTLYPKWVTQSYTIHYHIDENTTLESGTITSFNVESLPVTLKSATKTGYVFGGWYDNEDLTGDVVTTIPANTLTDVDLWPKFTPITYTITFNTNGGDGFKYPVTCTYDVDCDISNRGEIVFEGWTFTGWALSKRAQTPDYPDNAGDIIVRNLTSTNGQNVFVYAIWDANTISLTYNYKDDTNSSNTNMCTFDSSFVLPNPPAGAKAGYRFIGWRVHEESALNVDDYTESQCLAAGYKWCSVNGGHCGNVNNGQQYYICQNRSRCWDPCPHR